MNTKEHIKLMKRLIVLQYLKVKKVKRVMNPQRTFVSTSNMVRKFLRQHSRPM